MCKHGKLLRKKLAIFLDGTHESIVIQEILERISSELNLVFQSTISNELVGIESRVREMLYLYLDEGSDGVCFVGICGMGGIGNVHEGIKIIGNRLRGKKVLIVLDVVDGEKQLKALVGNHNWFGPGSRIIITSRNDHLLKRCGVDYIYTAKELNGNEALRLFSLSAFKNLHPKENYVHFYFVNYTKGLPLALNTLGSLLFNKSIDERKSAMDKLKAEPSKEILDVLQISFDGLTNMQKELFLDIACFFKQKNKDCVRDILKSFGYNPNYNIGVLMDISLITINKNGGLCMHDLLQEMGQQIVFRESPNEPGGRSRLWHCEDVLHTLKNNTGTDAVEGIELNTPNQKEESLSAEAFTKMTKLRFLKICNVQLPKGLSYLSNELRFIEWYRYPLKSMPTSFQPNKLVELRMRCSHINHLWKGIMNLDELRLIDLSDSQNLIEMPDLSGAPKLKQLILQRFMRLSKIHVSLGNLKCLIRLDLNDCKYLESLPPKISLEAIEILNLVGCSKLKKFPEIFGYMPRLSKLCLSGTAIKDLSLSTEYLTGLIKLDLRDCKNLSSLSNACCCSMSLKILTLSGCSKLNELPENLGNIKGLEELDAIPDGLGCLSSLTKLDLRGNNFVCLPESTTQLSNMETLLLSGCTHLRSLPELPLNIKGIDADGCTSLEILPLRLEEGPCPILCLLNCVKLINNEDYDDMLLTTLRHHIQFKFLYSANIIHFTNVVHMIMVVIDLRIGLGATAAAVASLLMRMIWKIQQKIPKLSESHNEYDRGENGTSGEVESILCGFDVRSSSLNLQPSAILLSTFVSNAPLQVNGCGSYIEAVSCKMLLELGSAEVWALSHDSMIICRVQANIGLACWLTGSLSINSAPLPEFAAMTSAFGKSLLGLESKILIKYEGGLKLEQLLVLLERTVIGLIGRTESIVIDYEQFTSSLILASPSSNSLIHNLFLLAPALSPWKLCSPSSNSLIGDIEAARKVFGVLPERGIDAWNAMIIAYSRREYPDEVLNLFCQMILEGVRTDNDILTFMVALMACTRLSDLKTGEEIWCTVMDCGFEFHALVGSSVLNLYAKCQKGSFLLDNYDKWGCGYRPDLVSLVSALLACSQVGYLKLGKSIHGYIINSKDLISWNAMITSYGIHGHGKEAVTLPRDEKNKSKTRSCYSSLLSAFSHSGPVVEACELIDSINAESGLAIWVAFLAKWQVVDWRGGRKEDEDSVYFLPCSEEECQSSELLQRIVLENAAPITNDMVAADPSSTVVHSMRRNDLEFQIS
uniref:Uncharacterized protein n=1 Tax=Quercus lobata TaxID=97700 RepID=A0A7N2MMN9_QUELO